MTTFADLIRNMAEAGASPEAIAIAVEALEQRDRVEEQRRAAARDKKRRQRAGLSRDSEGTNQDNPSSEGSSPTPPSPNLQPIPPSPPKGGSSPTEKQLTSEFENDFWPRYPNKVGKPVALKSYIKARKDADQAEIMDGLAAYVRKTDDRPWCNPSTWLNQARWTDLPAQVVKQPPYRERTILDAIDERLEQSNANLFDALRTIDAEQPSRREPSPPDLRLVADASRY